MLTKATIVTYDTVEDQYHTELVTLREQKIDELNEAGKTDGTHIRIDEVTIKRFWLNQAAADEWIAFMTASAAPYNINMSFVVEDIPT
jgi:FAD/FMN-containing dehydrogenase